MAVKLPRREVRNRKKALARFQQESRTASKLRGPNVVRVTDIAELDDGTPFMVMELLVGRDLARELDVRGALEVPEAVEYVLQAASGVAEAHAAGIVHRDLKPHNLFLVTEPARGHARTVKVLDFGISKLDGADVPRMTTTNARLGTPLYVSPEQLVSAKYVDARSDIWSLGVILYELLTGTLPFEGSTAIKVAAAIQTIEPPLPSARRPGIPAELEAVVMKALSKDAARRYLNVVEFAQALEPFAPSDRAAWRMLARAADAVGGRAPPVAIPAGGTLLDSPRDDGIARGRSPVAPSVESPVAVRQGAGPSLLLLALAALFGVALLALAFVTR